MNLLLKKTILVLIVCLYASIGKAQLVISNETVAQNLVQKLVGDGVTISNVTFTGNSLMAGYFNNTAHTTNLNIDSGIVLTTGRAKTTGTLRGVDGNMVTTAENVLANNNWGAPGDQQVADMLGTTLDDTEDACVLEFDFVPLGDSIKFRYVFSSEEYTEAFVCNFNDAFAFFISGPGITGTQNIALIPNTSTPVSILNVNNVLDFNGLPLCANNMSYYIDNINNTSFTHDGHTVVLTALSRVQPCQTYHLKLVISDVGDDAWDSGVFLEAKSLTSNAFQLTNLTQLDPTTGFSYLVEGCAVGALKIRRQQANLFSQDVNLGYGGTAINGIDVATLPSVITIPANQTEVLLNIFPTIDNIPEGIETLKIYTLAPCGAGTPTDSTVIQIRDYDTLGINPDTLVICRGTSVQLHATVGYSTYQWDANPALSDDGIREPIATPTADSTMFYCTGNEGTCHGRDSSFIYWKQVKLLSKVDVNCQNASTGQITVVTGPEWVSPVTYAIGNNPYQPDNSFTGLPIGTYWIKAKDATGCIDSVQVTVDQAFPNLLITAAAVVNGSCTGTADGKITVTATGGKPPLSYSIDGVNFQPSNIFNLSPGIYTVTVKDANDCSYATANISVQFDNTMTLTMGTEPTICEGKSTPITATTNGTSVIWSPATGLNDPTSFTPIASPTVTTKYYIKSTLGICDKIDSMMVYVNPAPTADAGKDSTICFGASLMLSGSGGVIYEWSPSTYLSNTTSSNPVSQQPKTTTYYLTVTDANGCKSLSTDAMVLTVSPPAQLFAGFETSIAINQPLQLQATDINHIGFTTYSWSPQSGLNNPYIPNPVATLSDASTLFTVTATTNSHCVGIATVRIKTFKGPEIYVANTFTPNGDGTNDVLKAFPVGITTFSYFRIYNRFGQMVFSTDNPNIGWDGKFKGQLQNVSTFVWMASGIDYHGKLIERKGTVTLVQ